MSFELRDPDSPVATSTAIVETTDFVAFDVAGQTFAMATRDIDRIAELNTIVPVPLTPAYVRGVTLLEGQLVAVADLPAMLGVAKTGTEAERLIVLRCDGFVVGIAVERLHRLVSVPATAIRPSMETGATEAESALRSGLVELEQQLIDIIDARLLIARVVGAREGA